MPSPVLPQSDAAIATAQLRRMVALSPTLQAGRTYDDTLRDSVLLHEAPAEHPKPYAVIAPGDSFRYELAAGGGQNILQPAGSLFLWLVRDTPPDFYADRVSAEHDAENWFGLVLQDVLSLADADDPGSEFGLCHLPLTTVTRTAFEETPEESWPELGRWYWSTWNCDWSWNNA